MKEIIILVLLSLFVGCNEISVIDQQKVEKKRQEIIYSIK